MEPSLVPIRLLHPPGDPEHSVSFGRRTWMPLGWPLDGRGRPVRGPVAQAVEHHAPGYLWEPLWNIFARDLQEVFPQILEQILEDSAFSVCGMIVPRRVERAADEASGTTKKLGPYRRSATRVQVGGRPRYLPRASRRTAWARALTAAWSDLDYYKLGLSEEQVVGALHGMQQRGELPPASLLLFSGRGLWTFWVLRDQEHPDRAVRAGAENVRTWECIQRAIQERLAHLGADGVALDLARMARVPGSARTDLGDEPVRIGWQVQGPPGSAVPFIYTLAELASAFGVEARQAPQSVAAALDVPPDKRLAKQRGARGRFVKLLLQLDWLEQIRGGWKIGTRGRAIWLQIAAMVSVRKWCRRLSDGSEQPPEVQRIGALDNDELLDWATAIAEGCQPGADFHPKTEARAACTRAIREGGLGNKRTGGIPPSYQTISEWLMVTPEETEHLRDRGFRNPLPPARAFWQAEIPGPVLAVGRKAQAAARRACLREVEGERLRAGDPWCGLRGFQHLLRQRGHPASTRTIMLDLAALGIENPNGRETAEFRRLHAAGGELPFSAA